MKLLLSIEDIKAIYNAGINRGQSEQSAAEWGCGCSGKQYDNLIETIVDITDMAYTDVENIIETSSKELRSTTQ